VGELAVPVRDVALLEHQTQLSLSCCLTTLLSHNMILQPKNVFYLIHFVGYLRHAKQASFKTTSLKASLEFFISLI